MNQGTSFERKGLPNTCKSAGFYVATDQKDEIPAKVQVFIQLSLNGADLKANSCIFAGITPRLLFPVKNPCTFAGICVARYNETDTTLYFDRLSLKT